MSTANSSGLFEVLLLDAIVRNAFAYHKEDPELMGLSYGVPTGKSTRGAHSGRFIRRGGGGVVEAGPVGPSGRKTMPGGLDWRKPRV